MVFLRGRLCPPDTPKPILFVQYGHSCIDLYLCGFNIKHNCVLKNTRQTLGVSLLRNEGTQGLSRSVLFFWFFFQVRVYFSGQGSSSEQRRYEKKKWYKTH